MIGIYFPITQGKYALVDRYWYDVVSSYKWYFTKQGYAENDGLGLLHQFIVFQTFQEYMGVIDHENDDKLDCREENLRIATRGQNRVHSRKTNRVGRKYKGVYIRKDGYIYAKITVNRKCIHLGYHNTENEAAMAYNKAAVEYFGKFAALNEVIE